MRRIKIAACLCTSTLAFAATPVSAAPAKPGAAVKVLRDCARDGKLNKKWSTKALKKAQRRMGSDTSNYSDCSKVIKKELRKRRR